VLFWPSEPNPFPNSKNCSSREISVTPGVSGRVPSSSLTVRFIPHWPDPAKAKPADVPPTTGTQPQSTALPLQERIYIPTITITARTPPQVREAAALYTDSEVKREWMEQITRGLAHFSLRRSFMPCRRSTDTLTRDKGVDVNREDLRS